MADCIFCQIADGSAPSWKVYETASTCAFLDLAPVNAYHTLVIPKRHYANIFDVPAQELCDVMLALKHVVDMYKAKLGIQSVQITNVPVSRRNKMYFTSTSTSFRATAETVKTSRGRRILKCAANLPSCSPDCDSSDLPLD